MLYMSYMLNLVENHHCYLRLESILTFIGHGRTCNFLHFLLYYLKQMFLFETMLTQQFGVTLLVPLRNFGQKPLSGKRTKG